MDTVSIAIAFLLGFLVRQIGLPPLVGYLGAGFALEAMGVHGGDAVAALSELGITLLLFTIGLKLRLATLLRMEVWGVATAHMLLTAALAVPLLATVGLGLGGAPLGAAGVVAFALGFSSTVFAVKVLEERGELGTTHGRIAIGILVTQDVLAVAYLALAGGQTPSPYAAALLALPLLRPLLGAVMGRCGHGELLVLFGLTAALGAAELFRLVGVEGEVGALMLGVVLASHPRAGELVKSLLAFKDVLLIGFFLSIGLLGPPDLATLATAGLLLALLPLKVGLLGALLLAAKVRARSAAFTSLALANYSEFGLIVAALAAQSRVLDERWTVAIAIAVALSFVSAAPLNVSARNLVHRAGPWLRRWERTRRLPGDAPIDTGGVTVMICGMGRVGTAAYDEMRRRYGDTVVGVDVDEERARVLRAAGRRVVVGDATDPDFWDEARCDRLGLVMLAMPNHSENVFTGAQLAQRGFPGVVVAAAQFPDEVEELRAAGLTEAYNLRAEAGVGFAELASALYPEPARSTEPG